MKEAPLILEEPKEQVEYKGKEESKIYKFFSYCLRFLELSFIFMPSIVLLPLCIFDKTR